MLRWTMEVLVKMYSACFAKRKAVESASKAIFLRVFRTIKKDLAL